MKKLVLMIGLIIACCSFSANAALTQSQIIAGQKKAAAENIQKLSQQISALKAMQKAGVGTWHNGCGPEPEPPKSTCVSNCQVRQTDGSCIYYGADFCGPNASCSENCEVRQTDGTCIYYGADICN